MSSEGLISKPYKYLSSKEEGLAQHRTLLWYYKKGIFLLQRLIFLERRGIMCRLTPDQEGLLPTRLPRLALKSVYFYLFHSDFQIILITDTKNRPKAKYTSFGPFPIAFIKVLN